MSVSQTPPPPPVDSQSRSVGPLHLPTPPHTSILSNSFHFILNFAGGWGLSVTPGQLGVRYRRKLSKEIIPTAAALVLCRLGTSPVWSWLPHLRHRDTPGKQAVPLMSTPGPEKLATRNQTFCQAKLVYLAQMFVPALRCMALPEQRARWL